MTFSELAAQFGLPVAMLLGALFTGARGVWVYGEYYRQEREARLKAEARNAQLMDALMEQSDMSQEIISVIREGMRDARTPRGTGAAS